MNNQKYILLGLLSGILWGLDAVLIGWLLPAIPFDPLSLAFAPLAVAACHDLGSAIWMLLAITRQKQLRQTYQIIWSKQSWANILAAIFGAPLGMSCYTLAIQYFGPAPTAIISSMYPVFGVLFAVLLRRDFFRRHMLIGLIIAITASISLSYEPVSMTDTALFGFLFAALCAVSWGLEGVISSFGFTNNVPADIGLAIRQLVSAITYICIVLPLFHAVPSFFSIISHPTILLSLFIVALIGTLSYHGYYSAIAALGPIRAMGLNITYSAWATIFSAVLLSTSPSFYTWIACVGVIIGSLWTSADIRTWIAIMRTKEKI